MLGLRFCKKFPVTVFFNLKLNFYPLLEISNTSPVFYRIKVSFNENKHTINCGAKQIILRSKIQFFETKAFSRGVIDKINLKIWFGIDLLATYVNLQAGRPAQDPRKGH